MTGPEHYRQAEVCLRRAAEFDTDPAGEVYFHARAQVHATLALTAATYDCSEGCDGARDRAWIEAVGGGFPVERAG